MKLSLSLFLSVTIWLSQCFADEIDEEIKRINGLNLPWKAGRNFPPGFDYSNLYGFKPTHFTKPPLIVSHPTVKSDSLPAFFDSRIHWDECPIIGEIKDQGDCGTCWAVSSASVISDRICIRNEGRFSFRVSVQDLAFCSKPTPCEGGNPYEAFMYWTENGIVSGGNYNSTNGCKPYKIPPVLSNIPFVKEHTCEKKCQSSFVTPYRLNLNYGKRAYLIYPDEKDMMAEIYKYGPIVTIFAVYEDFEIYKSGIYVQRSTVYKDKHAVKVLGWGEEDGIPYWLAANSWGKTFGEGGTFRFIRGRDECGFESFVVAGEARIHR